MKQTREERKVRLVEFLASIQQPGIPIGTLGERERMVESGLIDSLAVLQIVSYLEETHKIDFSRRGVDAEQLGSIGGILDLIQKDEA